MRLLRFWRKQSGLGTEQGAPRSSRDVFGQDLCVPQYRSRTKRLDLKSHSDHPRQAILPGPFKRCDALAFWPDVWLPAWAAEEHGDVSGSPDC